MRLGLACGLASVVLFVVAGWLPGVVEGLYSRGLYPWVARGLSTVTGIVPISLAEVSFLLVVLLLPASVVWGFVRARRLDAGRWAALGTGVLWSAGLAGWIWSLFLVLWGFNYAREPLDGPFRLTAAPDRVQSLRWIGTVGARLDALRTGLEEDADGVVVMPDDLDSLDREIAGLQARVLGDAGLPAVSAGRVKPLASSPMLLRWRVSGFYGPFTAEPNIVFPAAPGLLPFVIAHERAHLAGIAEEGEASYVALRTLWASEDPRLRYSAWLALWLHLHPHVRGRAPGVVRDLRAISEFSTRHRGWERPLVAQAYDTYLKAHGVRGGSRSYGRVARLALVHLETFGLPDPPFALRREQSKIIAGN